MLQTLPFNDHVADYEEWFDKHQFIFQSEVLAIRELLPKEENLRGLEIGTGTGRFADALGIKEAVEPADNMRKAAMKRGIKVHDAEAEHLPFDNNSFDYVLMAFCISYFNSLQLAFEEAYRLLKHGGSLIVGFIDNESMIGKEYEARRKFSVFYKDANFYSPETLITELKHAGFDKFLFVQTLFGSLDNIEEAQVPKKGFGEGSFVVIKAQMK